MELIDFLQPEDLYPEMMALSLDSNQAWGQTMAGISDAQKHTKGAGVLVAVLDSGVAAHPALDQAIFGDKYNCTNAGSALDHQGHGTHVAGIIAARDTGAGVQGVAPEARIMSVKVLNDQAKGNYEWIANGINVAVDNGADIINMSLGAPAPPPPKLHDAIKRAVSKGIIVVAAAGNDAGAVNFPGRFEEVIAVAAIDRDGKLARFSSHDPHIDVSAPGVDIYSTHLHNSYAVLNGTSQAAPFVAGICALLLSYARNTAGAAPIENYLDMLKALDKVCDPAGRAGFAGREGDIGFGIPNFVNVDWRALE